MRAEEKVADSSERKKREVCYYNHREPVHLGVFHLQISLLFVQSYELLFHKQAIIFLFVMWRRIDLILGCFIQFFIWKASCNVTELIQNVATLIPLGSARQRLKVAWVLSLTWFVPLVGQQQLSHVAKVTQLIRSWWKNNIINYSQVNLRFAQSQEPNWEWWMQCSSEHGTVLFK